MAKLGFPYYSADTDRFQDIKIKRLKKEFSCTGYAVYQYILNEIYRVKGCYVHCDENMIFDISEYWGIKETLVKEIINYCCYVGLFNKELYKNGSILTSLSIQSRYTNMCKLTKRKTRIPEEINLLSEESTENSDKSEKTPIFSDKENKNRIEQNKENPPSIPPSDEEESSISLLKEELKTISCCKEDFNYILNIHAIAEPQSPIWKLIEEVKESRKIDFRLTADSYLIPSIRSLVKAGKLTIKQLPDNPLDAMMMQLRNLSISEKDIEIISNLAMGNYKAVFTAMQEVTASKGAIRIPGKFIISKLK